MCWVEVRDVEGKKCAQPMVAKLALDGLTPLLMYPRKSTKTLHILAEETIGYQIGGVSPVYLIYHMSYSQWLMNYSCWCLKPSSKMS